MAEIGWNSLYWNNHDQPRVVSRFGDDHPDYWAASAKALATVLHGMRGTPFVYQGEELGMTNYPFRIPHDHKDIESVNYYNHVLELGGDEERRWPAWPRSAATTPARQCNGTLDRTPVHRPADPWMPVNPNYTWLNAASQIDATDSVFAHYQALIRLRHQLPILVDGDFTPLMAEDPQIWAYTRTSPTEELVVLANCGRDARAIDISPEWIGAEAAARQPARCCSHDRVNVARSGSLGRADLLGRPWTALASNRLNTDGRHQSRCLMSIRSGFIPRATSVCCAHGCR